MFDIDNMKVKRVCFGKDAILSHEVGMHQCKKIEYHPPRGEGDRHYVDIYLGNKKITRVFDISAIDFYEEGWLWKI